VAKECSPQPFTVKRQLTIARMHSAPGSELSRIAETTVAQCSSLAKRAKSAIAQRTKAAGDIPSRDAALDTETASSGSEASSEDWKDPADERAAARTSPKVGINSPRRR
jgi:hypothetical protein